MRELRRGRLELDHCERCSLLWFDEGELYATLASLGGETEVLPSESLFATFRDEPALTCPRCAAATIRAGVFLGIGYHRCHRCGGLLVGVKEVHTAARRLTSWPEDPAWKGSASRAALAPLAILGLLMDLSDLVH